MAAQESIEMTQSQVYGVSVSKDTGPDADIPTEANVGYGGVAAARANIVMKQNQVYGVSVSKDAGQGANIPTEANVGYGVTCLQPAPNNTYDYI